MPKSSYLVTGGAGFICRPIAQFATALLEDRSPIIYGDGEQTRDFTYVANVVDGVLRACEAPAAAGAVVNVATGGRVSLNELLRMMNQIVDQDRAAAGL